MTATTPATVVYGFHMSDLHDWITAGDMDDVNVEASSTAYVAALEDALAEAFPGALVDVRYDLNTVGSLPSNLKPFYTNEDGDIEDRVSDILAVVESVDANIESWIVLNG